MSTPDIHKASVLLMTLPREQAVAALAQLTPQQIQAVAAEIARCHTISPSEQCMVVREFANVDPPTLNGAQGGLDVALTLVQQALAGQPETLATIRQHVESLPFRFLADVDSRTLATFIFNEHPQTIALVLSYLPRTCAAEVIAGLPAELQLAVVRRIANLGPTDPRIVEEVAETLARRMARVISRHYATGGVPRLAEILHATDRATGYSVLHNIGHEDPELADAIRKLLYVFEDLKRFSTEDIQTIFKQVDQHDWALALKGTSDGLRQKVLTSLPKRAAARLNEAIEQLGPVRLDVVQRARRQIIDAIRRLEEVGAIHADSAHDAEEFVA